MFPRHIQRRDLGGVVLAVLGLLLGPNSSPAQSGVRPYITYGNDRLDVFFRASELRPEMERLLNAMASGKVHETDSQKASIRNPRVNFTNGAITVRLDYSAGTRGWTLVPAPTLSNPGRTRRIYTPWATDSGWVEADLRTQISNWVLTVYTRNGYVRWSSNNRFTNLVRDAFDNEIRDGVANGVNDAIGAALGGKRVDLRPYVLEFAPREIARQVGLPEREVYGIVQQALNNVRLDAHVKSDGILISMSLPRNLFRRTGGGGVGPNNNGPSGNVPAGTPNPLLNPTFGSANLQAGFTPDPFVRSLTAGGTIRTNLAGVNTHVAQAPDFRLQYTKGTLRLTIRVESSADTTLLIHLPDGRWVANDDGGSGHNPSITFDAPMSGRYSIFVGTYNRNAAPARLIITER